MNLRRHRREPGFGLNPTVLVQHMRTRDDEPVVARIDQGEHMRTHAAVKMAAGLVAGGAIALVPTAAGAWTVTQTFGPASNSTSGASANCTVYAGITDIHSDTAQIDCDLSDTSADSNSVYVGWKQDGFGTVSLYNNNGNGSTIHVEDARTNAGDGSFTTLQWKVCRDQAFSDNCSSWTSYNPK